MGISEFKAKCINELKEAQSTRTPILVTHRGKPLARVEPVIEKPKTRVLGNLRGSAQILGDIVETDFSSDSEALA